jgi:hypothetical protein
MKPLENGYLCAVQSRPVTERPTLSEAIRSMAAVVGVVALVLALLALSVYVVVSVDLMPQMQ